MKLFRIEQPLKSFWNSWITRLVSFCMVHQSNKLFVFIQTHYISKSSILFVYAHNRKWIILVQHKLRLQCMVQVIDSRAKANRMHQLWIRSSLSDRESNSCNQMNLSGSGDLLREEKTGICFLRKGTETKFFCSAQPQISKHTYQRIHIG